VLKVGCCIEFGVRIGGYAGPVVTPEPRLLTEFTVTQLAWQSVGRADVAGQGYVDEGIGGDNPN
jgi:hypothetical protein